ncbi:ATP-binding protein, partial [Calidifontibacillus erzurumensis]
MSQLTITQEKLKTLHFSEAALHLPHLVREAEEKEVSYLSFLNRLLDYEKRRREEKQNEKRMKWASFPFYKTLDEFHLEEQQSLSRKQFNQLRELTWIEQLYNIILLGPPGVGKTHLAVGLGLEAIQQGYKVMFITMGELIHILKTEEISRKSHTRLKRIRNANLTIIDDLMFMA